MTLPLLISDLLPATVGQGINYRLRNNNAIRVPFTRTESYRCSFIPFAITKWNNLPAEVQNSPTLVAFKLVTKPKPKKRDLYYFGERLPAIHHAHTRLGCSKLNGHLCHNLRVIPNPACLCGYEIEDPIHFYLHCPLYTNERTKMNTAIAALTTVTVNNILFGDPECDLNTNKVIFGAVHKFILETNRFAN